MKDYFSTLFNYDRYANDTILNTMFKNADNNKAVELMAHLLVAQQIWLNRCKGLPAVGGALWPDWQIDDFSAVIAANSREWLTYLDALLPTEFEKLICYKNSTGDSFKNKLIDVLAHLINHGTHHRAQIGQ